jgi:hypothetical protein
LLAQVELPPLELGLMVVILHLAWSQLLLLAVVVAEI